MFPENCNGCTTYVTIIKEGGSISKIYSSCLARKAPICPCMNCLTKCMCSYKMSCYKLVSSVIEYLPDGFDLDDYISCLPKEIVVELNKNNKLTIYNQAKKIFKDFGWIKSKKGV